MFIKKLERFFLLMVVAALGYMAWNRYDDYRFKHGPLPEEIQLRIDAKEREIISKIRRYFNIEFDVPVIVSDRLPGRLYGVASYHDGEIRVYLNKKVMKESLDYVIDDVLPHEYAHALMFHFGHFNEANGGHSKKWQHVCLTLGSSKCDRYVDTHDIIMGKLPF